MIVHIDEKIKKHLEEIAALKNCTIETAAFMVLARYSEKFKGGIK